MDYEKLVDFMGENIQIDKTVEEVLELAEAIMKVFKIRDKDIIKEIKHKENLLKAKYPGVLE